jgi:hypothetical protein
LKVVDPLSASAQRFLGCVAAAWRTVAQRVRQRHRTARVAASARRAQPATGTLFVSSGRSSFSGSACPDASGSAATADRVASRAEPTRQLRPANRVPVRRATSMNQHRGSRRGRIALLDRASAARVAASPLCSWIGRQRRFESPRPRRITKRALRRPSRPVNTDSFARRSARCSRVVRAVSARWSR